MPGIDRKLDPAAGDYIDNGLGGTETTRSAVSAVHHQAQTPLGSWFGDAAAGRRAAPGKSSVRTPQVVEDIWREAMAPLVADGRVSEPRIVVEREDDTVPFEVEMDDLASGEKLRLSDQPEVSV